MKLDNALKVCAVYWPCECRDCPIMRECHAPLAPLTRERLDAHNRKIEEAAREHEIAPKNKS